MLKSIMKRLGQNSRLKRARFLRSKIDIPLDSAILDLGGGTGEHISRVFPDHRNITVCDYSSEDLRIAAERFGYKTVLADGTNHLPFADKQFDFVFCSSVIEHVTGPKELAIATRSTSIFKADALRAQEAFAREVQRVARNYYVQTPHRYFLIESHSWLPLPLGVLPRPVLIPLLRLSAKLLPKGTAPDWNLLIPSQIKAFFPGAEVHVERVLGWPKSIMAIKGR